LAARDIAISMSRVERLHSALGYKPTVEFEAELGHSRNPQPKPETALSPN
jgi:hypothetical protein